jgi:hypothetical protein
MRKTESRELLRVARRRQRDVLCDVMLSARQCESAKCWRPSAAFRR